MHTAEPEIYDAVGLGFGPASLALAIALEEHSYPVTNIFFERQPALSWHRGMLVPSAKMQVSFLKDLVTFRNPSSRFSFISYLHAKNRLARFTNKKDFFPTRQEFHDYLEWAESRLASRVTYNTEAVAIRLPRPAEPGAPVDHVCVAVRKDGVVSAVPARNVVISTGLVPRLPPGIERGDRVWHSAEFLGRFAECNRAAVRRVAVVGAGQSAAELARYLYDQLPEAAVYAIMTSYGYSIADSTPFANEIYDPAAIDTYYDGSPPAKDAIWDYHRNTNFSVVDDDVIRDLYYRAYDDEVSGSRRMNVINLSRVTRVQQSAGGARVTLRSLAAGQIIDLDVDVVICATGYDPMMPDPLLAGLSQYCARDQEGRYIVKRDYQLETSPEFHCGIYLQGGTEHSHGLSASLLSNVATRAGDIAESIAGRVIHRSATTPNGQAAPSGRP
jgi:L-ornithine N5-monooxygenase